MIEWSEILYGAGLSAVLAALLLVVPKSARRRDVILPGVVAALAGPIA